LAQITTLKQMAELVKGGKIKRVAVACGQDPDIIDALARAVNEKLAIAILIGDKKKTEDLVTSRKIDPKIFTLIDEPDPKKAAARAVEMVKKGEADVLMKGLIDTAIYARAYLNKETGLLTGATVSHVAVFEVPNYPRLLIVTDAAQLPYPTFDEKVAMINHAVEVAHKLGIEIPKVAVLAAVEKVNPKMPVTLEAATLAKMCDRGRSRAASWTGRCRWTPRCPRSARPARASSRRWRAWPTSWCARTSTPPTSCTRRWPSWPTPSWRPW
jgi:phosphate butyryltransferase